MFARAWSWVRRRPGLSALIGFLVLLLLLFAGVRLYERITGTSITVRFGSYFWIPIDEHSWWVDEPVRMALRRPVPPVIAGNFAWRTLRPGFDVAELPVMAGAQEVDRILLARIEPAHYRVEVQNEPSGRLVLEDWMARLGALLVVNGSYYGRDGRPATPAVIGGKIVGPASYQSSHGAFVSGPGGAALVDLKQHDWRQAFAGSHAAMVSYPMLIGDDGANRSPRGTGWLANRSFMAQDGAGLILIGTTKGAFFSLDRLGDFLKAAPLDLKLALDLDGGPIACQAIAAPGFERSSCGKWEVQVDDKGHAKTLPPWPWARPSMPMVLAVFPR